MRLKDYLGESIYAKTDDPSNPEVLVDGGGRNTLKNLTKNIQGKLAELAEKAAKAEDYDDWKNVLWMMEHAWMHEATKAIVRAKKELESEFK